jgi:perosamine synthetase
MIRHSAPTLGPEEEAAATRVLRSGCIAQGPEVEAFEFETAEFAGGKYAVAVSSGTAALHLVLEALIVQPNEAVAVPSYACAALPVAVRLAGGTPALCDATETGQPDAQRIPNNCRIAVVAHLFGARADMPQCPILVDDLAQCFGIGSPQKTAAAIVSFYATKLLTCGEGGMVLTDDAGIAEFVRDRRDYDNRDDLVRRFSYKMTDIQAAIGRVQLRRLPSFLARRREIATRYIREFEALPLRVLQADSHAWFRFVVTSPKRDALQQHLMRHGIEGKRPVHAPAHLALGGVFPNADKAHREFLSIPIYPSLLDSEADDVIRCVQSFFR